MIVNLIKDSRGKDIIQIDDARLVYKNFKGASDRYNREGDRNFGVRFFNREVVDDLIAHGWNVHIKEPKDDDTEPFMYLPVKIKFTGRSPIIYVKSGRHRTRFDEELVGELDEMDIENVDLDIRAYDWDINGKEGRTAYLQAMEITQRLDRFAARYAEEEYPQE